MEYATQASLERRTRVRKLAQDNQQTALPNQSYLGKLAVQSSYNHIQVTKYAEFAGQSSGCMHNEISTRIIMKTKDNCQDGFHCNCASCGVNEGLFQMQV